MNLDWERLKHAAALALLVIVLVRMTATVFPAQRQKLRARVDRLFR